MSTTSHKILFVDHYDSFSNNLIHWLSSDAELDVLPIDFDKIGKDEFDLNVPIVLSPGPKGPDDCQKTLRLVRHYMHKVPILGVCLGHQILGQIAGHKIDRCNNPSHGSLEEINVVNRSGIFMQSPEVFEAAVYNSLIVSDSDRVDMNGSWIVSARNKEGYVMALENWQGTTAPAIGIQFHPESYLCPNLGFIQEKWKLIVREWYKNENLG